MTNKKRKSEEIKFFEVLDASSVVWNPLWTGQKINILHF
jgi:hypothetical protein